jgi:hypothetical protein
MDNRAKMLRKQLEQKIAKKRTVDDDQTERGAGSTEQMVDEQTDDGHDGQVSRTHLVWCVGPSF